MIPVPLSWAAAACAVCAGLGALGGWRLAANIGAAREGQARTAAAVLSDLQRIQSTNTERNYVERLEGVQPPPLVVVRDRIVRAACRVQYPASDLPMPAGHVVEPADAASAPDPDTGIIDGIAVDAAACVRNRIQLDELQALIRANAAAK